MGDEVLRTQQFTQQPAAQDTGTARQEAINKLREVGIAVAAEKPPTDDPTGPAPAPAAATAPEPVTSSEENGQKTPVEPKESAQEQGPTSQAWLAVRRAEHNARVAMDTAKKEKEEAARLKAEAEQLSKDNQAFLEGLGTNPKQTIANLGIDPNQFAMALMSADPATPTPQPQVAQLPKDVQDRIAAAEARAAKAEEAAQKISSYVDQIQRAEATKPYLAQLEKPEFALLAAYPSAREELPYFVAKYKEATGQDLTPEQAASMLQDGWKKQLESMKSNQAVMEYFGQTQGTPTPPVPPAVPRQQTLEPRTLSNNQTVPAAQPATLDVNELRRQATQRLAALNKMISGE